ncbi:MAG: hypothetical protein CMB56_002410 [Methanobacteriota archaeon]|nr:MAG: hypothetical protein CMB56_002410 [Euryarchaeota archaeon]|tara:strand:- start:12609 stop:12917 length:309 start_codon:yes stop_codon:yes gene_type:complete
MPKIKKAARGKHRWIGLSFSDKISDFTEFKFHLESVLSISRLKYLDYYNKQDRKSCIIKVSLNDYLSAREILSQNPKEIVPITSSGKLKLVRQRLDAYFAID